MTQKNTRRAFVQSLCGGLGSVGLISLLANQQATAATLGHYTGPRLPIKAKHVIFLFMGGGPSHIDMFDPKPVLAKYEGQRPGEVDLRTERKTGGLLPSPFTFKKYGRNGVDVSELLPRLAASIDDICVIRSMYSFNPTHAPAQSLIHSGSILANRPTIGAWCSYGLGTENENLPAFIALTPGQGAGGSLLRAGFLPAEYQGTAFDTSVAEPEKMIRYLRNTQVDTKGQRWDLDAIQALNREHLQSTGSDEFLEGRI